MLVDGANHVTSGESISMVRRRALKLSGVAAGVLLAACGGVVSRKANSQPGVTSTAATGSVRSATGHGGAADWLYVSIITGGMIHKKGWPEYVPGDFTVPAHSSVRVEIRCFDDGSASIPGSYSRVKGTLDGTMAVTSGTNGVLSSEKVQTVKVWDPKKIAHTLTVPDIGLNIPVPPMSTVKFTFVTGAPGTHVWQCMSKCGSGSSGWGGAMASNGWMKGTMTVAV